MVPGAGQELCHRHQEAQYVVHTCTLHYFTVLYCIDMCVYMEVWEVNVSELNVPCTCS